MSFSQQVKNELLKIEYDSTCCEKALLYGMCIFGKSFSSYGVGVQTENKDIAIKYASLIEKYCNIKCDVKTSPGGKSQAAADYYGFHSSAPWLWQGEVFLCSSTEC